ncbi:MAG: PKD domain-containing protein, partial [Candidatus Thermoplasmatota archaeon]|nr:PKD domain-containing protein [Candidatus Thermoplasmatota archaeon]
HRDHGGTNGWGEPRFTSSNVRNLKNDDLLPVVFSINCLTGYFDNETALGPFTPSEESFAEHLVNQEGGGAVGVVAATRVSYSGYNDYFYKGLYDAIFPSLNTSLGNKTGIYRMGEVLNYAKYFMSSTWGDTWGIETLEYELFHYLGDPTMEIWTAQPQTIIASHQTCIDAGKTEIRVNASEENATVCVSRNGSILGVGIVKNGSVNISVLPLYDGTITVTITKHDLRPYIANISVNATSIDLCVSDIFVSTSGPAGINWTVGGTVTNSGTVDVSSINVSLKIDGNEVNSTKLPQLTSGSSSLVGFNWTPQNDGWHTVLIEVENKSEQIGWNNHLDRSVMVTGDPDIDMDTNGSIDLWWRTGEIKEFNISLTNEDHGKLTYELEEKCLFFDGFSNRNVSAVNWINHSLTIGVGTNGLYPPSLPYSIDLLCGDNLTSRVMDTTNYTELNLSFHLEMGGYSNLTESYDHLYLEYKDNRSQWIRLCDHLGDNYQQGYFTEHIYGLPKNASHDSFQFRFTSESAYDYFGNGPGVFCMDDIRLTHNTDDFWLGAKNRTGSLPYHGDGNFTLSLNATSLPVGNHSTFITLISNDEEDGISTISVHFEVRENITPVADAGSDIVIGQHETVMFNGSDSTDNYGIVNWTWTFYDGDNNTLFGELTEHTFHEVGVYKIYLQVNDHALNMDIDIFNVTVLDTTDPEADAGWDVTIDQHEMIYLNGSGSSDNVGIVNWTWMTNDREGEIILYGSNPSHTFNNAGIFPVNLTVRDLSGNKDDDTIIVKVNDTTEPTASAGQDMTVNQHEEFILYGSGSSDNIGVINWTWEISINDMSIFLFEEEASYTIHEAGSFEVVLNVTDERGNHGTDTLRITVNDTTPPEIPRIADIVIDQGTIHLFNGSFCIDNVGVINWTWEFSYEGENITLYGSGPRFEFATAGKYPVILTIRDEAGSMISGDHNITVLDIRPPRPMIEGDLNIDQHEILSLDGSSSTDNVGITNHTWNIAGPGMNVERYGLLLDIRLDDAGDYNVTLHVGDAVGNNASISVTALVRDATPPICIAGENVSIYQGSQVIFNGSDSYDSSGQINYTWTFEYANGTVTLYGPISSFDFEESGNYTVTLTVTDEEGNTANNTLLVTVIEEPEGDDTPDDDMGEDTEEEVSKRYPLLYMIPLIALLLLLLLGAVLVIRRKNAVDPEEEVLDWEE